MRELETARLLIRSFGTADRDAYARLLVTSFATPPVLTPSGTGSPATSGASGSSPNCINPRTPFFGGAALAKFTPEDRHDGRT